MAVGVSRRVVIAEAFFTEPWILGTSLKMGFSERVESELLKSRLRRRIRAALSANERDDLGCKLLRMVSIVVKMLGSHKIIHNGRPRIRLAAEQNRPSIVFLSELWVEVEVGGKWG